MHYIGITLNIYSSVLRFNTQYFYVSTLMNECKLRKVGMGRNLVTFLYSDSFQLHNKLNVITDQAIIFLYEKKKIAKLSKLIKLIH